MALTIEEIDVVEKIIAFHVAGHNPAVSLMEDFQKFYNLTDEDTARFEVYYKRAIVKYFNGSANYPRLATELKLYDRRDY